MLRPTAYLTFVIDGPDATSGTASLIKRSFSYIAPTKILGMGKSGEEAAEGAVAQNSIAMEVRLAAHPFWFSSQEGADQVWEETVVPWLRSKLGTLFGTVRENNNESRKSFERAISYRSFRLAMAPYVLEFGLEPDSSLRDVTGPLAAVRAWLNQNADEAANVVRFLIPSNEERGEVDWFDVVAADGSVRRVEAAGVAL